MPLEVPGSPAGRALPRACSAALALCQERSKIRTSGLCLSGRMGVDGKVPWRMSTPAPDAQAQALQASATLARAPDPSSRLESLRVQGRSSAAIRRARPRQRLHTGMIEPGQVAEGFQPSIRIPEEGDTRPPVQRRGVRFEVV